MNMPTRRTRSACCAQVLDTTKAEGEHVRSFQLALSRLMRRPDRARRGSAHLAPLGVPLHPQACQLAQHGRDRDRRPARSVPRPRRIDDSKRLVSEIAAWERQRNAAAARIKWMFTTAKARAKMGRAYPDTFKES
jgi:hypothetical protein